MTTPNKPPNKVSNSRKYGSRQKMSEEKKRYIQEKIKKQKEAEIKAAIILTIMSLFIQVATIIFYFNKTLYPYTLLPAILGLLLSGMALGLIHTDKVKKFFVTLIFIINLSITVFVAYVFFMQEKEEQEEEIKKSQMSDTLVSKNNDNTKTIKFEKYG